MTISRLLIPLDGSSLPNKSEIGGKAWSIARMRRLGLRVPPAVALPVSACHDFYRSEGKVSESLWAAAMEGVRTLEQETGRRFGHGPRPLLLSVRSGAAVSMPGMMDTVLDLGINERVETLLAEETGDAQYAEDTHRRFVSCYGKVVCRAEIDADTGIKPYELRAQVLNDIGQPVPDDPWEQLLGAIAAVFSSWNSARARSYRRHWGISEDGGTAVTMQAMVFGNVDDNSGTGVLFTRNPLNGDKEPYGEYLPGGQGEDIVSGSADPVPLNQMQQKSPQLYRELVDAGRVLEREAGDVQDVEFTVERGTLYLLQSRTAKRAPRAAIRIAVDLVHEGSLNTAAALRTVSATQVRSVLRPQIDPDARSAVQPSARGEAACPGIAQGLAVTDPDDAVERAGRGQNVVLVTQSTSPEDVHGMTAACGVGTERGGATSHAAVVSRALGRPCVVGCGAGSLTSLAGHIITVDGTAGEIFTSLLPLSAASPSEDPVLAEFAEWAFRQAPLKIVKTDEPGAVLDDVVNLDALKVIEPDDIADAVGAASAARGAVLDTDAGIHAALHAGIRIVIVEQPLPAAIAAIAAEALSPPSRNVEARRRDKVAQ